VVSTGGFLYAALDEDSGYGEAARRLVAALRGAGDEVTWLPFRPGPGWSLGYEPFGAVPSVGPSTTAVAHLTPEYYPAMRLRVGDARLVAHTVWETDRLPRHWPALLAHVDQVVVPCRWNAEVFGAEVSVPVSVVPHVAPEVLRTTSPTWAFGSDTFVCYSIAPWTARKAPWLTVAAFLEAFGAGDDVVLVLLTSPADATSGGSTVAALARVLAGRRDPPKVLLVTRKLDEEELAALHTRGDCFVSLCRSEGWGLGAFDAGAYGNEVVITGFGGQLDYLDAGVARLVDHEVVPVEDPAGAPSYTPDQTWAEPSVAHAAVLLREAYDSRNPSRGQRLAARIAERYAPGLVADRFRSACYRDQP
jgi:hypothetical protein